MSRPSRIDKLPASIREVIGQLRRTGATIDDILDNLRAMLPADEMPSRSGVGRYVHQYEAIAEEMRRQGAIAEILVERYGNAADGRTARLNIALAQGLLTKLMFTEDGRTATLNPEEAMFVARSIQSLVSASKSDADREMKLRQDQEKRTRAEAVQKVDTFVEEASKAGERGLSAERINQLRRELAGTSA